MRTIKFFRILTLVAFAAFFSVSCSKETDEVSNGYSIADEIGSIVDFGPSESGIRLMQATLVNQSYTVANYNDGPYDTQAHVQVQFFVDEDGLIPSGQYVFSNSGSTDPFTFKSAVFSMVSGNNGNGPMSDEIIGGSINVNHNGNNTYSFEIQAQLYSGSTVAGSFNCALSYRDDY